MHSTTRFPHHKLLAYHLALQLAEMAKTLADDVPHGWRKLADQIQRSGTAPALLIAEAANRYQRGIKRQRFREARGEAGECAATAELLARLKLVSPEDANDCCILADRLCAMLTRLVGRFS